MFYLVERLNVSASHAEPDDINLLSYRSNALVSHGQNTCHLEACGEVPIQGTPVVLGNPNMKPLRCADSAKKGLNL